MTAGRKQRTLAREGSIEGTGLHTGEPARVSFKPLPPGSGVVFTRGGVRLEVPEEHTLSAASLRCTSVGNAAARVQTVEHLLAALTASGIDNVGVEVDGPEIPGLDGCAAQWVRTFKELGTREQTAFREFYSVTEPLFCYDKHKAIAVYPADTFSVAYVLDYGRPGLNGQVFDAVVTPETFEKEIAPARTFCTEKEIEEVRAQGFGKGARPDNTLVIGEDGEPVGSELRFADECARHKVLDIIGDLSLTGFPILGRVVGLRSGHALNHRLAQAIKKQKEQHDGTYR